MILIPQIYLRGGKVARSEQTTSPLFVDDPFETANALKGAGAEGLLCMDLSLTPVGTSPNLMPIKKIHDEVELGIYVGGGFKTPQEIEGYVKAGVELVIIGSIAYQKPDFLESICKSFPGKIAVHIDVKAGRVTIPGYAVASNKTPFDYAEEFVAKGVRYILYSEISAEGKMDDTCFNNIEKFCNEVTARVICTSNVNSLNDIERLVTMNAQRLEALVLAKSLYEGRIDLMGANAMIADLSLAGDSDSTLTEM